MPGEIIDLLNTDRQCDLQYGPVPAESEKASCCPGVTGCLPLRDRVLTPLSTRVLFQSYCRD